MVYMPQLTEDNYPAIREWMKNVVEGHIQGPTEINEWLGLAEFAVVTGRSGTTPEGNRLLWMNIAVSVYTLLSQTDDPYYQHRFELSAMSLRANVIHQYGVQTQNALLDPKLIEEWFLQRLPFSIEHARDLIEHPSQRTKEDQRYLKEISQRCTIMRLLLESTDLTKLKEIQTWCQLADAFLPE